MQRILELTRGFYTRLGDLIDDLKDAEYEIEDANREYVSCWGYDGVFYTIYLSGTERTFYIDHITADVI